MKRISVLLAFFFFLFFFAPHQVFGAKRKGEDEMKKTAKELSYSGQLDRATELLGEKTELSSGKAPEGWDTTSLMLSMVWGAIGAGFFMYGKRQSRALFLLCGIGLCVFPMLVSDNTVSLVLGIVLTIVPFKIDI
jgi:hypothetical protein